MDQWRKISPIRHYELRPLSAWISPQRTLPVQRVISIFQSHCSPAVALSGHPPSQLALRSLPCRSRRAALCLKRMLSPHIAPQRMLLGTSHLPSLPFYKCQHPLFQASFQTDEFSDISCAIAWVQLVQGGCKIIAICKIPQWEGSREGWGGIVGTETFWGCWGKASHTLSNLLEPAGLLPVDVGSRLIAECCAGIVSSVRLPVDTKQLQFPPLLPAAKIRGVSHVKLCWETVKRDDNNAQTLDWCKD